MKKKILIVMLTLLIIMCITYTMFYIVNKKNNLSANDYVKNETLDNSVAGNNGSFLSKKWILLTVKLIDDNSQEIENSSDGMTINFEESTQNINVCVYDKCSKNSYTIKDNQINISCNDDSLLCEKFDIVEDNNNLQLIRKYDDGVKVTCYFEPILEK